MTANVLTGLPTPGTLEHAVMLGLHRAAQSVNQLIRAASQLTGISPPDSSSNNNNAVDKIGVAEDGSSSNSTEVGVGDGGGLLGVVASLPQSVQQAAVQVRYSNILTNMT